MFEAVGMRSVPKGGFGNRVLNYLCLRHLADQLGVPYFSVNPTDKGRISGINRRSVASFLPSSWTVMTKEDVHQPDFMERARHELDAGHSIVFKPRLLDVTFAYLAKRDSRELVTHRMSQCRHHRAAQQEGTTVVLHLRGTDFSEWNPQAIHGADYYVKAVELVRQSTNDNVSVRVCTDDPNHPAGEGVREYLKSTHLETPGVDCLDPFHCDFAAMAEADYLVASPSTFATIAGLLGRPKVIYQRQWVEETAARTDKDELWWKKVRDDDVVGLDLFGLV